MPTMFHDNVKLRLESCALMVEIGIHDFEQNVKQRVLVDVELDIKLEHFDEDIANTLDYDKIRNGILALGEQKFKLQETLCKAIVELCFFSPLVTGAKVYCRKVDVYPESKAVGIEIYRTR